MVTSERSVKRRHKKNTIKTSKSLVIYFDDQFKKDFKNNTEVEIAEKVNKVI